MRFDNEVQPDKRYKASQEIQKNYTLTLNKSDADDLTLLSEFLGMPRSKVLRKLIRQASDAIKFDIQEIKNGL